MEGLARPTPADATLTRSPARIANAWHDPDFFSLEYTVSVSPCLISTRHEVVAYDSPVRRAKAQETERRVLAAAAALFTERGYVGTSLAAVAEEAGVNARTVYKVFGSKVALQSRLVDVAMVGDQEAVPVAGCPWAAAAFDALTGRERVRAYAGAMRRVMASAGTAFRIAAQTAAADPEAAALWAAGQRLRLQDSAAFIGALHDAGLLRSGLRRPDAVATVWLVSSPETFTQLSDGLGWSIDRYGRWVDRTLADTLL